MKKTLLLIVLLVSGGISAKAQLIDIQFGGDDFGPPANVQSGVGIIGSSGDQWNDITGDTITSYALIKSTGGASGATLTVTGDTDQYSDVNSTTYPNSAADTLGSTTVYNLASGELESTGSTLTLNFQGLKDSTSYTIELLTAPDNWNRSSSYAVYDGPSLTATAGPSQTAAPLNSTSDGQAPTNLDKGLNYLTFTGTTDSMGNLAIVGSQVNGTIDLNGVQLQAAVPEPSTYAMMLGGLLALVALSRKRGLSL